MKKIKCINCKRSFIPRPGKQGMNMFGVKTNEAEYPDVFYTKYCAYCRQSAKMYYRDLNRQIERAKECCKLAVEKLEQYQNLKLGFEQTGEMARGAGVGCKSPLFNDCDRRQPFAGASGLAGNRSRRRRGARGG